MAERLFRLFDQRWRHAVLAVSLTSAFAISVLVSVLWTRAAGGVSVFWPANACLAAALLLLPRRWGIIVAGACAALNLAAYRLVGDPVSQALTFTALNIVEATAVAILARRALGAGARLTSVQRVARLLGVVVLPVTAAVSLAAAAVGQLFFQRSFPPMLAEWFLADALGMAIVLPAILLAIRGGGAGHRRWLIETLAIFAAIALVCWLSVGRDRLPLIMLVFPLCTLAALRLGPRGAASAVLFMAVTAATLMIRNPDSGLVQEWSLQLRIHYLQFLIALAFFTSLTTALALSAQARLKKLYVRRGIAARRAGARAVAASRAKSAFLATMSHEVRAPMNSISGFSQMLMQRDDLPEAARRQVSLIERSGAALMTVVNNLLDYSAMETGDVELRLRPRTPQAIAQDALAIVAEAARRKGLGLELTLAGAVEQPLRVDDLRLRQILLNLLGNAIKFTDSGHVRLDVQVRAEDRERRLRFAVTDTGVGMSSARMAKLVAGKDTAEGQVTGLGLAICRGLAERMGGHLGGESTAAEGSTFWVEITADPADADAGGNAPARILLVDDHPASRELGQAMLQMLGCEVDLATNGREAVRRAAKQPYDAVLMDVRMPEMDGLTAAATIRAGAGPNAKTPIIAMTADVLPEQVAACRAAGMVDHVGKPITVEALRAALSRWVGRAAPERAA
jgi:signal transduction histidine kinase/ActR/RegA family two-component response regulator